MELARKLAEETRARLAAERLLDQKSRELFEANRRLSAHAQSLTKEISQTRRTAEDLRGKNTRALCELEQASEAASLAERRLWDAVETVRDGFALFDAEDRLIAANRAYLSIFDGLDAVRAGVGYDEILHLSAEEGIVDTGALGRAGWIAEMRARWRADPVPPRVVRLWTGQYIKLIDRRTPAGDMVSVNLDITEMMRIWSAVEAIPDGFVLFDHEDRLVMCNERYREIYAESAPALQPGASFEDILRYGLRHGQYGDAGSREDDWLADRLIRHQSADGMIEQQLGNGRWVRILEKRTPDGGLAGLRVDITEQKRQQQALEEARVAAEAANRAKSAFLANMSHELRTPMNGVVGMAELLCDTDMTGEQRVYAQTIRSSAEALLTLLNDVLDYSKIEAEKLTLHAAPFDLERIVHEVFLLLQPGARAKGIDTYIDYDMFLPTRFRGDAGRVRQVLTNLVGNAVKFTEEGHVLVRVVGLEAGPPGHRQIHITVEDTGIGIDPEMHAHVFGEFNQVEDQQNRMFEGTGLGLSITRRLVGLMGGEIWLESRKGEGACFGVRLVLPVAESAAEARFCRPEAVRRVTVVDDHEVNRTILDRQLSQLGIKVTLHRDAEAALADETWQAGCDLVITDYQMPGRDGVAFARALRETGFAQPVVLLSSDPSVLGDAAAREAVDAILQKPLLRRRLYEAIESLAAGAPPGAGPARAMRVLTAEDNRTNRLVFGNMVKGADIELTFAESGEEALAAWQATRPDLIFMDISMPGLDGKATTRAIRAREAAEGRARVPIVALTAHALEGDGADILAAGLDEYLTKPLRRGALVQAIAAHAPPGCRPVLPERAAAGPG
ncbi:signal transduction histidine kinase/DNA-binding response OmpR family regulator [Rhodovulum iodosum]|uniref:histidine kinase n=1 Tax=Rhodovulum iodosum TaxID=68291 RepID=A0ABV3XXG2_9RHOB|nr:response regulator [Rhodovulum robiginosum]RSK40197.1 response regulator [Rhodovulum robiginosum]